MKAKQPVKVRAVGTRLVEFTGGAVLSSFTALNVRYMRNKVGGGWLCPEQHAADVMAHLEHRGIRVEVTL